MPRRVLIIGVGGIGTHLAHAVVPIMNYGDPDSAVLLVDGDRFETDNRQRQNFEHFGNKAESLALSLQERFPQTYVIPVPAFVVPDDVDHPENPGVIGVSTLLAEGDVVLVGVDNDAARALVANQARQMDNVDVIIGGNDEAYFGSLYHYMRRDGNDVTDHPAEWQPELANPADANPGLLSCAERAMVVGGQQIIATNMSVAAMAAARLVQILNDTVNPSVSCVMWDLGLGKATSYDRRAEVPASVAAT